MSIENTKNQLNVLLVGCGNIAGNFDHYNQNDMPLTHAGAFSKNKRFKLLGCVDPDEVKLNFFKQGWKIGYGFNDISECIEHSVSFDVISICTPTEIHLRNIELAIQCAPKLIFCEKPITNDLSQTVTITESCNRKKILFCVNYNRRWDEEITQLKKNLESQKFGKLRTVFGVYNKGLLNNGSHMVDLLNYLMGPLNVLYAGHPVFDYSEDNPSIPFILESSKKVPINISCGCASDYSLFELHFIFENCILRMENGGENWVFRSVTESTSFRGYRVPSEAQSYLGSYKKCMTNAVENIAQAIDTKATLLSDAKSAQETQLICEKIIARLPHYKNF